MEYPKDLDECMWYIFSYPFPQGADPLEDYMLKNGKLKYIICFGETDYMDQVGSRRLEKHDPDRFKVLIVSKKGHRFPIENAKEVGDYLRDGLRALKKDHPCIGDVRGTGLFTGLELVKDPETKEIDPKGATLLINRLRYNNVLIGAAGPYGNILKIRPPLRFYKKDADFFIEAIKKSLTEIHL